MEKNIKDYLHLYLGCDISHDTGKYVGTLSSIGFHTAEIHCDYLKRGGDHKVPDGKEWGYHSVLIERLKPILRPLSDMTEEEMIELLQSMVPYDMKDKPTVSDYDLEMFYNDNATMVDGDVAVGANVTCICWVAQVAITYDGTIHQRDENGELERQSNVPQAYRWLLSKHFDLFGLIESGLAISKNPNP